MLVALVLWHFGYSVRVTFEVGLTPGLILVDF